MAQKKQEKRHMKLSTFNRTTLLCPATILAASFANSLFKLSLQSLLSFETAKVPVFVEEIIISPLLLNVKLILVSPILFLVIKS